MGKMLVENKENKQKRPGRTFFYFFLSSQNRCEDRQFSG